MALRIYLDLHPSSEADEGFRADLVSYISIGRISKPLSLEAIKPVRKRSRIWKANKITSLKCEAFHCKQAPISCEDQVQPRLLDVDILYYI